MTQPKLTPFGKPITIKMPKKSWKKWEKALLGDKFTQCSGQLYREPKSFKTSDGKLSPNGGFCCLGVMEYVLDNGKVEFVSNSDSDQYLAMPSLEWLRTHGIKFYDYDGNSSGIDAPVVSVSESGQDERELVAVSELNDSGEADFKAIAGYMREHVMFTDKELKGNDRFPKVKK
jgi:hypothetical protein